MLSADEKSTSYGDFMLMSYPGHARCIIVVTPDWKLVMQFSKRDCWCTVRPVDILALCC